MYPHFGDFLPIEVTTEHWVEVPEVYNRLSLVICLIQSVRSVYVSILPHLFRSTERFLTSLEIWAQEQKHSLCGIEQSSLQALFLESYLSPCLLSLSASVRMRSVMPTAEKGCKCTVRKMPSEASTVPGTREVISFHPWEAQCSQAVGSGLGLWWRNSRKEGRS